MKKRKEEKKLVIVIKLFRIIYLFLYEELIQLCTIISYDGMVTYNVSTLLYLYV
jgi:hypothetical protein